MGACSCMSTNKKDKTIKAKAKNMNILSNKGGI